MMQVRGATHFPEERILVKNDPSADKAKESKKVILAQLQREIFELKMHCTKLMILRSM